MPEKLDRCVKAVMEQGKSEESAHAICQAQFSDSYRGAFRDSAVYDPKEKTAISIRDGVLEYLGSEIGMEPAEQTFTIYRSPATIANASMRMRGIPLTDEHVSLEAPAPGHGGFVNDSEMIDATDETTKTTIATKNKLSISDTLNVNIESGKRELSLGYNADLVPHDIYDFEQKDIMPHHLAIVDRGRCGAMCSFIDRKPSTNEQGNNSMSHQNNQPGKLPAAFLDQEGNMSLQQIVELATRLPEAIKQVPVDKLSEVMPAIQQIVELSKSMTGESGEEEVPTPDENKTPDGEEMEDEDMAGNGEEDKEKFADAVSKAADKKAKAMTDAAVKRHSQVIEKARDFVEKDYQFSDKSTEQIMRDALATETTENFADGELDLAFKMLKKSTTSYQNFGDAGSGAHTDLSNLAGKDL